MNPFRHIAKLYRMARREDGATAVEFAILLPVMLVTFGVIVEGARIYWNYQAAVSGVRDAARYLARISNNDVCSGGTAPANASTIARGIIERNMGDGSANLFPRNVVLDPNNLPTASVNCISVTGITGSVPVYRVDATIQIGLPLSGLWSIFQTTPTQVMTSTITDQSRIYGL